MKPWRTYAWHSVYDTISIRHHQRPSESHHPPTCKRSEGPLYPPFALGERSADTGADGEAVAALSVAVISEEALSEAEGEGSKGNLVGAPTLGHFLAPCEDVVRSRCGAVMSWWVPEDDVGASLGC